MRYCIEKGPKSLVEVAMVREGVGGDEVINVSIEENRRGATGSLCSTNTSDEPEEIEESRV